jgi:dienelactone hydrolase
MMRAWGFVFLLVCGPAFAESPVTLPGTEPLAEVGDLPKAMDGLSRQMLDGLHRFLDRKLEESIAQRAKLWKRDTSSRAAYEKSIEANRESFRKILGVVDPRVPVVMERFSGLNAEPIRLESTALGANPDESIRLAQVRWRVLDGVHGEGLIWEPNGKALGHIIALPDADQTPEQIAGRSPGFASGPAFAWNLAVRGFRVIVPTLISRDIEFSGNPKVAMTNQSHREWIYRQAYHMGRHVIGYEVQKVLAAVDWIRQDAGPDAKIGVVGYGEGGLIAFYAAAIDPRIDAALVSGYFGSRQRVWDEPIYRNVWGLLHEFGDAEIATLIAPRALVVEHSQGPVVEGPPAVPEGRRGGGAVGKLGTPTAAEVQAEWDRLATLLPDGFQPRALIQEKGGPVRDFAGRSAVEKFLEFLGADPSPKRQPKLLIVPREPFDSNDRQRRQVRELEDHVQRLVRGSDATCRAFFLNKTSLGRIPPPRGGRLGLNSAQQPTPEVFAREADPYREILAEDVLGRIHDQPLPPHPRTLKVYDKPKWAGYLTMLDVFPHVVAWGVLLLPKDLKEGEKRPVVVCQHGRNGLPSDVIEGDNPAYHDFAARLAERGFVVFAPHNLYRGEDRYRMLNRKGNPIKLSMFSFITAQHQQMLDWLGAQPFVDPARIAFYGLSYGGETAVRVPPLLKDYCLSICSADFNDWTRKIASDDSQYSFMFTIEWEMPYFNMGSTFNYSEMVYLMVPRPFMAERGHDDGVAPDPWVASEYAKIRWVYDHLGLADRTRIEFFNGGHTIHGQGTFDFLHEHLRWPRPEGAEK